MSNHKSSNPRKRPPSLGAAHTDLSDYASGNVANREMIERRAQHLGGSRWTSP